jgi:hypothetical protein
MATPRVRYYTETDTPRHADVRVPASLAVYLYRERLEQGFKDESELVCHIIRQWADSLDGGKVDWKKLLKQLKEEEVRKDAEAKRAAKKDG